MQSLVKVFNRYRMLDMSSFPFEVTESYNLIEAEYKYPGFNIFTMNCKNACRTSTTVTDVPLFQAQFYF